MKNKEEIVNQAKNEILSLLNEVNRPGIDKVIWYLGKSDFFRASCHSHHKFIGGLAVHSLGVYKEFKKINTSFPEDSIRIVCLLHDICKAHLNGYNHIGKGRHGFRSVELLKALKLQFEKGEEYAILKHMHRISHIPSGKTYDYIDMFRHYIHQSDHRDCESYPKGFDSYTQEKSIKYQIDTLLYTTHRSGIEIVIDGLHRHKEAFFKAPASVKCHDNYRGGLANHSLKVFKQAIKAYEDLIKRDPSVSFSKDSVILCSLLHDVCKKDEYELLENSRPTHTKEWIKNGPHGLKSLRFLRRWHLHLTEEEEMGLPAFLADGQNGSQMVPQGAASVLRKISVAQWRHQF